MSLRRSAIAMLAALTVLTLAPAPPASAGSAPINDTIAPAWGRAVLEIVRSGWTVNVEGTLADTREDGDCVYVEAVLEVDHNTDPDKRTGNHCRGVGTSTPVNLSLTPPETFGASGSRLDRIRVRVCAVDRARDSCEEHTHPVPPERAVKPQYKGKIDRYMGLPLAQFMVERGRAPEPFDWSTDGCSVDVGDRPGGFDFGAPCTRHDFGYRNLGVGEIQASPIDATRAAADSRFYEDMMDECAKHRWRQRIDCENWASGYYQGVRQHGGRAFYT